MGRTIILTEAQAREMREAAGMSEYRFNRGIRGFLRALKQDPVHAQPGVALKLHGLDRRKLLRILQNEGLVVVNRRVVDRDDRGEPSRAVMRVSYDTPQYDVPRDSFERKLKKLYIKLFECNVPGGGLDEECCGSTGAESAGGGQMCPAMGPALRRGVYPAGASELGESLGTCNAGDYEYTVPFGADKDDESLRRGDGAGGSTSVQTAGE